jgi:hypothetical protein
MSNTITEQLKEATKDLLTEDTLQSIEESFNQAVDDKVQLHVEKALVEQDEEHAVKLEKLLEAIDADHTKKLKHMVSAIDANHGQKLKVVAEKFNNTLNEEAGEFKEEVIDGVSNYLDLYLEETIPQAAIKQAMENTHAVNVLQEMRKKLSVDRAMATNSIRDAVVDGKKQIEETSLQAKMLEEKNAALSQELNKAKSKLILEEKTQDLPENKKRYMFKVLGNKTPGFINENYDYTLNLLEKTEEERLEKFKQEAQESKTSVDRPPSPKLVQESAPIPAIVSEASIAEEPVIEESVDSEENFAPGLGSVYMNELNKF